MRLAIAPVRRLFVIALSAAWLIAVCSANTLAGDSWLEFRGPTGQGISDATGLPTTWSETENVRWKTEIPGKGWSSPVVLGKQIWMTTATDDGHSLRAECVDRETGKLLRDIEVFHVESPPKLNPKNSHASPTPVLEPGRVYVYFGTNGAACLNTVTGKIIWTNRDLKHDHSVGPGSSPISFGNLLIVNCDGMDVQYVVALNKQTGKPVWKTDRSGKPHDSRDRRKAFSTPLIVDIDGQKQLISPGANQVVAYNPTSGEELWKVTYDGYSNVPRPVLADGTLIIGTGFDKAQLWGIHPGGKGDLSSTNVAWKMTKEAPLDPSPIYCDGNLYIVSDSGVVTCLDPKTGKDHWRKRLGGDYSASPILADGRIFFFGESGDTTTIQPGDHFEQLQVNHLDGRIMGSPAIVDREIILRTDSHLYRIENK